MSVYRKKITHTGDNVVEYVWKVPFRGGVLQVNAMREMDPPVPDRAFFSVSAELRRYDAALEVKRIPCSDRHSPRRAVRLLCAELAQELADKFARIK